jgi:hypothetical protein
MCVLLRNTHVLICNFQFVRAACCPIEPKKDRFQKSVGSEVRELYKEIKNFRSSLKFLCQRNLFGIIRA